MLTFYQRRYETVLEINEHFEKVQSMEQYFNNNNNNIFIIKFIICLSIYIYNYERPFIIKQFDLFGKDVNIIL